MREPSGLTTIHTTYYNSAIYHTSSGARREMVYGKINIYFFASSLGDLGFQAPDSPLRGLKKAMKRGAPLDGGVGGGGSLKP
jgi:hypothetical protein